MAKLGGKGSLPSYDLKLMIAGQAGSVLPKVPAYWVTWRAGSFDHEFGWFRTVPGTLGPDAPGEGEVREAGGLDPSKPTWRARKGDEVYLGSTKAPVDAFISGNAGSLRPLAENPEFQEIARAFDAQGAVWASIIRPGDRHLLGSTLYGWGMSMVDGRVRDLVVLSYRTPEAAEHAKSRFQAWMKKDPVLENHEPLSKSARDLQVAVDGESVVVTMTTDTPGSLTTSYVIDALGKGSPVA